VSLSQQSYLASIIPQLQLAPYSQICTQGAHLSSRPPEVIGTDQYDLVLLARSRTTIMATPSAAFDMADFVDFGESGMPNVSQEINFDVSEPSLHQK
jgi:hypothetical protein